jgi:hypothetical protein
MEAAADAYPEPTATPGEAVSAAPESAETPSLYAEGNMLPSGENRVFIETDPLNTQPGARIHEDEPPLLMPVTGENDVLILIPCAGLALMGAGFWLRRRGGVKK